MQMIASRANSNKKSDRLWFSWVTSIGGRNIPTAVPMLLALLAKHVASVRCSFGNHCDAMSGGVDKTNICPTAVISCAVNSVPYDGTSNAGAIFNTAPAALNNDPMRTARRMPNDSNVVHAK